MRRLLRSLGEDCSVAAFRYQNLLLIKNVGATSVLVRSRTLRPGDFSRLYQGERVVLDDVSLDYADLIGYFNAKKNLTGTQLYLTLTDEAALRSPRRAVEAQISASASASGSPLRRCVTPTPRSTASGCAKAP